MTRHFALSTHPEHLQRWQQALPEGLRLSDSAALPQDLAADDLLWLQLDDGEADPGKTVAALRARFPFVKIIVLSNQPGQEQGLAVLQAGVLGYCHAQAAPEMLQQVALAVAHGGLWVGPELMARVVGALAQLPLVPVVTAADSGAGVDALQNLTQRERGVAELVAQGVSNKEAARQLGITERTVKAHLGAIFEKLGVRDRVQLVLVLQGRLSPRSPTAT